MTCIVGIENNNKVYMGSDSCASTDLHKTTGDTSKLFIKENILFGYAGSYRFYDILQYHTNFPYHSNKVDDKEYLITIVVETLRKSLQEYEFIRAGEVLDDMLLIGYNGKLYHLSADFSLIRNVEQYGSIGSGMGVAMGSLFTTKELNIDKIEDRISIALRAAAEHSHGIAAPFHFMSI